ncbi:hypothetical protein GCM10010435_92160 [Winogradskya consettensis]|uniref:Transposase n=1 Tax=Winogradskya consettensis TaxID=113560 RepID=A0A919T021_9ACTN|nr:hypothetical protein Aco04nite_76000 [Actinoplanes consettensis]
MAPLPHHHLRRPTPPGRQPPANARPHLALRRSPTTAATGRRPPATTTPDPEAIRRGTFTSVGDLVGAIRAFIDGYNQRCEPFRWTKTADQILAKANRQKTSDPRH